MKLNPKYSYEFNKILNEKFDEQEQIKNFASLLTDKDRFMMFLPMLSKQSEEINKLLGFKLKEEYDFYIVRAEKFKSFSEPITIEYSILPEEMVLYLLKEIIKIETPIRFPNELTREQYVNTFIDYLTVNLDWGKFDLVKYSKNLHDESKANFDKYELKELDFSSKTLKEHIEELYKE